MIAPHQPANEAERLTALNALEILDTPPEERFDRITRLVSEFFKVPIAYVAMVDANRQWLKSSCGWNVKETGRDISFCGHTILQDQTLIIPDAKKDARFADNPMVINEPYVRFYAGRPLRAFGQKVGTLCLVDHEPREVSAEELKTLDEFAAMVEHELTMLDVIHVQRELLETKEALIESRQHLAQELKEATEYTRSLLPSPLDSRIRTDWRFIPCTELGGDFFGYSWIDDDHFAVYLIDVCGHGVGAALLSVSVVNLLRSQSLPETDLRDPGTVLTKLNEMFPMEANGNKYFTAWYGVYRLSDRRLRYASGGHPPALLLNGPEADQAELHWLTTGGLVVGAMEQVQYETKEIELAAYNRLYVYSDGVYEVETPEGTMQCLPEFGARLSKWGRNQNDNDLDEVYERMRSLQCSEQFDDDFSLLRVELRDH